MANFNIHPAHLDPQNEGSSFVFTTPVDPYQYNQKAYQNPTNEGSSFTFSGAKQSGYQYILNHGIATGLSENAGIYTAYTRTVTRTYTETVGTVDLDSSRLDKPIELMGIDVQYGRKVTRTYTEGVGSSDISNPARAFFENVGINTAYSKKITRSFTETIGAKDDPFSAVPEIIPVFTTKILSQSIFQPITTSKIILQNVVSGGFYTTQINTLKNALVGATATGQGPLGDFNPFAPVVAIGGVGYVGTPPPSIASTAVYIDLPNSTIPNNTWATTWSCGVSINPLSSTWSADTLNSIGTLGSGLTVFGLNATLTSAGQILNNSRKGYRSSGIFGAPLLNKELILILGAQGVYKLNQQINAIANPPQQGGSTTLPNSSSGISIQGIARMISLFCGIELIWAAADIHTTSFTIDPTQNAASVLQSPAGQVGAQLRWFGNNTYYVTYPNYAIGNFIIPSTKLIDANGLYNENIFDLETGISGAVRYTPYAPYQGIFQIPTPSITVNTATVQAPIPTNPGGGTTKPTVTKVYSTSTVLTTDDPPYVLNLPQDYQDIKIHTLLSSNSHQSGITFNFQGFTTDPNFWFDLNEVVPFAEAGTTAPAQFGTTSTLDGQAYIPQLTIDPSFFTTTNPDVAAGNFNLEIGVTKVPLPFAPTTSNSSGGNTPIAQFFKIYSGEINCLFFGVVPLPGMFCSVEVDGVGVQGVIESASITMPGKLTIEVAQYARINWLQPNTNINSTTQ